MGYLISASIVRTKANFDRLSELPANIGHRVYFHRSAGVYMIDAFRKSGRPRAPFQSQLPAADISLELPSELESIALLHRKLVELKFANALKRSYINFSLMLSKLLDGEVLTFVSDDDDLDFACISSKSTLTMLRSRCDDLEIKYKERQIEVRRLQIDDEFDFISTNLSPLRASLPDATFVESPESMDNRLHAVAMDECCRFCGMEAPILGLGDFDPPDETSEWELLTASQA